MPPTETKYTPGAERAARKIAYALVQPALANTVFNMDEFAAIISRETHDAEMLEALKRIVMEPIPDSNYDEIRKVIAKVEGR